MISPTNAPHTSVSLRVDNYHQRKKKQTTIKEILSGLQSEQKQISSVFFYDPVGSKLFEDITHLPEYYPTRTEMPLIEEAARGLRFQLNQTDIVEFGSGDCSKISVFLEAIPKQARDFIRYIPVDVSQSALVKSADSLARHFPRMQIHAIVADFITQLDLIPNGNRRFFCLFGSTIGNLSRERAAQFLKNMNEAMQPGDRLLLGVDRVKDKRVLELAYNDSQEVTAAFNRNILKVTNSIAETDFDPDAFEHLAFYNENHHRIEMHLVATKDMKVVSPHLDEDLIIRRGETIHTENSHKFTDAHIASIIKGTGLKIESIFTDKNKWFSLVHFVKGHRDRHAPY